VFGLDIFSPVMSDFHPRYAWTFATTSSSARTRRTACPNRLRRRLLLSTIIASLGLSFTERFIRSCRRGGITGSSHLLQLHYHDRASLLAGKLHAVHTPKGATSSTCSSNPGWSSPNLTLLNHALAQTGWGGLTLTDENQRAVLRE
jgi:hypothetical protein